MTLEIVFKVHLTVYQVHSQWRLRSTNNALETVMKLYPADHPKRAAR
jgi:hypothetical protein